jgi:hypothetical protein
VAANPQLVIKDIPKGTFTYDGVPNNYIARGTIIDVPASSALATALSGFISALTTAQAYAGYAFGASNIEDVTGGGNLPFNQGQV